MAQHRVLMSREEIEPQIYELTYALYAERGGKFLRCVREYTSGRTIAGRSKEVTYKIIKNCRNAINK